MQRTTIIMMVGVKFGGTSAATPIVAGSVALALEAKLVIQVEKIISMK